MLYTKEAVIDIIRKAGLTEGEQVALRQYGLHGVPIPLLQVEKIVQAQIDKIIEEFRNDSK